MHNKARSLIIVCGFLTIMGVVLIAVFITHTVGVSAAGIGQNTAVATAVRYAQQDTPSGRMVTVPTQAYAKVMTLGEAYQTNNGSPLQVSSKLGQGTKRMVWLVVLRGDFSVAIPEVPGRAPASSEISHQQALILDATTGELIMGSFHHPTHELVVAGVLPEVVIPSASAALTVPVVVKATDVALPTRLPAVQNPALPIKATSPATTQSPPGISTPTPAR